MFGRVKAETCIPDLSVARRKVLAEGYSVREEERGSFQIYPWPGQTNGERSKVRVDEPGHVFSTLAWPPGVRHKRKRNLVRQGE